MLDGINMLEGQNVKSSKHVGGENLLNIVWICEGKYVMYIFEGNWCKVERIWLFLNVLVNFCSVLAGEILEIW